MLLIIYITRRNLKVVKFQCFFFFDTWKIFWKKNLSMLCCWCRKVRFHVFIFFLSIKRDIIDNLTGFTSIKKITHVKLYEFCSSSYFILFHLLIADTHTSVWVYMEKKRIFITCILYDPLAHFMNQHLNRFDWTWKIDWSNLVKKK